MHFWGLVIVWAISCIVLGTILGPPAGKYGPTDDLVAGVSAMFSATVIVSIAFGVVLYLCSLVG